MTAEPLFTAPVRPLDIARIEEDARRMRAEALRDMIRSATLGLARLWTRLRAATLRTA